jgi:hypothetical protein
LVAPFFAHITPKLVTGISGGLNEFFLLAVGDRVYVNLKGLLDGLLPLIFAAK